MTRYSRVVAILVATGFTPVAVMGAAGASPFTLGKAVPADVFLYIHGAYNPKQEYVHQCWREVWNAFKESGVTQDVYTLISSAMEVGEREKLERFWKSAGELIDGVDWQAQVHEYAYVGRMNAPMPEWLLLLRFDADKAARNGEAFVAILKEIAQAAGENNGVTCTSAQSHGATVWSLSFKDAAFVNIRVAVRGEVVTISADRSLLDESLALLAGEGEKKGLIQTERFRAAMAKLPPPEDMLAFFDFRTMLDGMRSLIGSAVEHAQNDPKAKDAVRVMGKLLDEIALVDSMASTAHTDGYRQLSDTIITLAPDAEKSRLYKVFCKPEPIQHFDRYVPKEATGYYLSSGIDWSAFYTAVVDFIGQEVPGGKDLLTKWSKTQDDIGFHPDSDLLPWLGAQMISVELPAAVPTPFGASDSVMLIKVRDEKLAADKIKVGLDKLNDLLTGMQQPLTSQPAEIHGAQGFRSITHPMVAMFLHPVYGVADGYLIIGSSAPAIDTCLATARGERPSVAKNERVIREALIPTEPVSSASFADMTEMGKNIATVLSALGFVSAMIPNQEELKPMRGIIAIAGKLAPVAMKIDFFLSQSAVTTFDGKAWHVRSVINYRPPKPQEPESRAAGGS